MKNGLPKILLEHLRKESVWEAKNKLTAMVWKYPDGRTYGAGLVDRKLRILESFKFIAVKYENGHAFYRYIPEVNRKDYIPTSDRALGQENRLWIHFKGDFPPRIVGYEHFERDGENLSRPVYKKS